MFADFDHARRSRGTPIEVPVDRSHPPSREWAVVCEAAGYAACVAEWEPATPARRADAQRVFEVLLTPESVVF